MVAYRQWLRAPVAVGDVIVRVASKPGVTAHGSRDVAAFMLADAVADLPLPAPSGAHQSPAANAPGHARPRACVWQAGNGLVPALLERRGWAVLACDRIITNVEATRRTLAPDDGASALAMAPREPAATESAATESAATEPHAAEPHAAEPHAAEPHAAEPHAAGLPNISAASDARVAVLHAPLFGAHVATGASHLAVIRMPTDRISTQLMIDEAFRVLAVGGVCLLAGANDEGAKPAARALAACFGNAHVVAQHSGHRLLRAVKRDAMAADGWNAEPWNDLAAWHVSDGPVVAHTGKPLAVYSRPGVFSWEHLDEATALLVSCLDITEGESVLDLGCGAGALGVMAALEHKAGRVLMLDADSDAVRSAQRTADAAGVLEGARVEARASDVTEAAGDERFDVVISNPPFHLGKATDLLIPSAFIDESHERLRPGGRLLLVANRTLPYERLIATRFGEVRTVHDGRRFKVLGAIRPPLSD